MAKYSVYAVAQGVDPVDGHNVYDMKFYSWGECMPYVKGARFCRYKGFMSDTEADAWLAHEREKRHAYPALAAMEQSRHKPISQPSTRYSDYSMFDEDPGPYDTTNSPTATIAGTSAKSATEVPSGDVKFRFSSKCIDLGLDPNQVLLFLMNQWLDMAEMMNVGKAPEPDDDDEVPW